MDFEKVPLALCEGANIHDSLGLNPHPLKGGSVGDRRYDQFPRILKTDESANRPARQSEDGRTDREQLSPGQVFPCGWEAAPSHGPSSLGRSAEVLQICLVDAQTINASVLAPDMESELA